MLSEILGLSLRQSSEPDLSHFKGIDPSYSPLQNFSGNRHCLATTEVQNCPFTYMYFYINNTFGIPRHIPTAKFRTGPG